MVGMNCHCQCAVNHARKQGICTHHAVQLLSFVDGRVVRMCVPCTVATIDFGPMTYRVDPLKGGQDG